MSQVTTFALWQFAKSTHLRKRLREEFGAARAKSMARMMEEGKLEGDDGDTLHDFLLEGMSNEGVVVWETVIEDTYYGEPVQWPVYVKRFYGVYQVHALEYDPSELFESLDEAQSHAHCTWENVQRGWRVKPTK